jgi:ATP-binding cassette subfamily F protein uup
MSLLRFDEVSLDFGELKILTGAEFSIDAGERVCLIGRNGAGKSTTLKLITGELEPDRGEIVRSEGLVISQLSQTLPEAMNLPVRDVVRSGLNEIEALLAEYQRRSELDLDREGMLELEALHARIDAHEGWHIEQRVDTVITDLNVGWLAAARGAGEGPGAESRPAAAR